MKNLILLITLFLPLLGFAQLPRFVVPFEDGISLNLPMGVNYYSMMNKYDTLFLFLDIGESVYGREISFNTEGSISDISIEQQVEYCFSITDRGPHIDLRNWLVGYTPWQSVQSNSEEYLLWANSIKKIVPQKPKFDVKSDEFLKAILAECSGCEYWQERAQEEGSIIWSDSNLLLKVSWLNNGKSEHKIIVFQLPMGC